MRPIEKAALQSLLDGLTGQDLYLHLETTTGAYAALQAEKAMSVCAYIRNGLIQFQRGAVTGDGPFRVGLKLDQGWVYAEGLTDWEQDGGGRLLMAGHDAGGGLCIALELSPTPFEN